jgi:hypothetical protein
MALLILRRPLIGSSSSVKLRWFAPGVIFCPELFKCDLPRERVANYPGPLSFIRETLCFALRNAMGMSSSVVLVRHGRLDSTPSVKVSFHIPSRHLFGSLLLVWDVGIYPTASPPFPEISYRWCPWSLCSQPQMPGGSGQSAAAGWSGKNRNLSPGHRRKKGGGHEPASGRHLPILSLSSAL